jgi:hypothetical protein
VTAAAEPRDYCPRCGTSYEPLQEYCLECGGRLPTNRGAVGFLASHWQRRFARYPGDWIWPVLGLLALTALATAAVVAADTRPSSAARTFVETQAQITVGPGAPRQTVPAGTPTSTLPAAPPPTIGTGTLPVAPGAPSTSATTTAAKPKAKAKANPNALAQWPPGKSGYTDVLLSVGVSAGRDVAVARARAAKQRGLGTVGILVSSQYSSLHPGYFVVYSGIYATSAQAREGLAAAHAHGFPDAYQTPVTR